MAFGPRMRITIPPKNGGTKLTIEMGPLKIDDMARFIGCKEGGLQDYSVLRYLSAGRAASSDLDEANWFDDTQRSRDSLAWGIWVVKGKGRLLIGSTSLVKITAGPFKRATSGSLIFDKQYWNKGIATCAHRARALYAFREVGLTRIDATVFRPNVASRLALEAVGYTVTGVERNATFTGGKYVHMDRLECLNPIPSFWRAWWKKDVVPPQFLTARETAKQALQWAQKHVSYV